MEGMWQERAWVWHTHTQTHTRLWWGMENSQCVEIKQKANKVRTAQFFCKGMFWRRYVQKCGGFGPTPASTKEGRSSSFLYLPGGSVKCDRRRLGLHCCSYSGCFKSFLRTLRHSFLVLYPVGEAVGEGKKDKCITFIHGKLVLIHSLLLKCCIFHLYRVLFCIRSQGYLINILGVLAIENSTDTICDPHFRV